MIERKQYKGITWIDIESPTAEEIEEVSKQFKLHPLISTELGQPSARPKIDPYHDYIYTILHFPIYQHKLGEQDNQEIDFVIGKSFLITTHYQQISALNKFKVYGLIGEVVGEHKMLPHAGFIFYNILKHLYEEIGDNLHLISKNLASIEEEISMGHEQAMVNKIGVASHDILDIKRAIKSHEGILSSFETAGKSFFGPEFRYYLSAIIGEHAKLWDSIEDRRETLADLRDTNDSLLNAKSNQVMKVLTIMAFIALPLSLLASIFGMNTEVMPIIGLAHDFWIIVGAMIILSGTMLLYFRYKRWF